jgi:hypothetical protein
MGFNSGFKGLNIITEKAKATVQNRKQMRKKGNPFK